MKKFKIGKKVYKVKEKSLAYYILEYILPIAKIMIFLSVSYALMIMLYYILLPYSTIA